MLIYDENALIKYAETATTTQLPKGNHQGSTCLKTVSKGNKNKATVKDSNGFEKERILIVLFVF